MTEVKTQSSTFFMRWRERRTDFLANIPQDNIMEMVKDDGGMTSRYLFMIISAVGIAILGLLQNSPAVIIGAMLISPLMGPIVAVGFSLATIDYTQFKRSAIAIAVGTLVALTAAYVVVILSPLNDPTAEILARTRPNLFDLLVAVLSGLAGGYAVVNHKGGTIVGVAIATALMPPLAVTGYGLATLQMDIAQGAFFLFMTNLLAIALSVTLIAKFYGFGTQHSPKHLAWQATVIAAVFVTLSLPLGVTLKEIALETLTMRTAKNAIEEFTREQDVRINDLTIEQGANGQLNIDAIALTRKYDAKAEEKLKQYLVGALGDNVHLTFDQVVVGTEVKWPEPPKITATSTIKPTIIPAAALASNKQQDMINTLKQAILFPIRVVDVDINARRGTVYAKNSPGVTIVLLRQAEKDIAQRFPEWTIRIVPPLQPLPMIYFEVAQDKPAQGENEKLDDIIWAMRAWEVKEIDVIGYASTSGDVVQFDNTSLAYRRALSVAQLIDANEFTIYPKPEYKTFLQTSIEKMYGQRAFQRVEVRIHRPIDVATDPNDLDTDLQASKELEQGTPAETASTPLKSTTENIPAPKLEAAPVPNASEKTTKDMTESVINENMLLIPENGAADVETNSEISGVETVPEAVESALKINPPSEESKTDSTIKIDNGPAKNENLTVPENPIFSDIEN